MKNILQKAKPLVSDEFGCENSFQLSPDRVNQNVSLGFMSLGQPAVDRAGRREKLGGLQLPLVRLFELINSTRRCFFLMWEKSSTLC